MCFLKIIRNINTNKNQIVSNKSGQTPSGSFGWFQPSVIKTIHASPKLKGLVEAGAVRDADVAYAADAAGWVVWITHARRRARRW